MSQSDSEPSDEVRAWPSEDERRTLREWQGPVVNPADLLGRLVDALEAAEAIARYWESVAAKRQTIINLRADERDHGLARIAALTREREELREAATDIWSEPVKAMARVMFNWHEGADEKWLRYAADGLAAALSAPVTPESEAK